jgi:hypothetical protein
LSIGQELGGVAATEIKDDAVSLLVDCQEPAERDLKLALLVDHRGQGAPSPRCHLGIQHGGRNRDDTVEQRIHGHLADLHDPP